MDLMICIQAVMLFCAACPWIPLDYHQRTYLFNVIMFWWFGYLFRWVREE